MGSSNTSKTKKDLARQKNLLANQKPRRRKPTNFPHWRVISITGLIVIGLTVTIHGISKLESPQNATISFIDRPEALAPELKTQIARRLTKLISNNPSYDLTDLALQLQTQFQLESVSLTQALETELVVHATERSPIFYAELDQLRPVSPLGRVYISANPPQKTLPVLKNLPREGMLQNMPDGTFRLDEARQTLIDEALDLHKKLTALDFSSPIIVYEPYRGFMINLNGSTEVFLGRKPFESRLIRLRDALKSLAESGTQATRIELDYVGKAFIKRQATL